MRNMRTRLLGLTALAAEYCVTLENAAEDEPSTFVASMIRLLPRLYMDFTDIVADKDTAGRFGNDADDDAECGCDDPDCRHHHHHHPHDEEEWDEYGSVPLEEEADEDAAYYASYVDEDYYNSVRRHVEQLLGPDDVFLETFEEDMKYSDTPIAASVSECLADIFQSLYNFISVVKDTDGEQLEAAYRHAREEFVAYWSQTLCNVLRALNHIYYNTRP